MMISIESAWLFRLFFYIFNFLLRFCIDTKAEEKINYYGLFRLENV